MNCKMSPIPCDKKKYAAVKSRIYAKYAKHGAYRSSAVVKAYKASGGRYCGGSKASGGLTRWHKEKWKSEKGKKDYGGRKVGNFRPTVKVSSKTPKLMQNVSKADRAKARARKRTGKNAKY